MVQLLVGRSEELQDRGWESVERWAQDGWAQVEHWAEQDGWAQVERWAELDGWVQVGRWAGRYDALPWGPVGRWTALTSAGTPPT